MNTCDVLVVGGGPAGSSCAWKLRQAGLDVIVADTATFPRDKVCAGWITPQAVTDLQLDIEDYRAGRTFQPITGFRVGLIDGRADFETDVEAAYDRPVSFGIRRCEFDHYLLRRSTARLRLGTAISSIRRVAGRWIVDDSISAPMLIGAGGHFCPVARMLNRRSRAPGALRAEAGKDPPLVVAQEAEFPIDDRDGEAFRTAPEKPELYFCRDLEGYGWCFRKQNYLNVGFGRVDRRSLPRATADFIAWLQARRTIPPRASWRWHGHAYLLSDPPRRRMIDEGVMLVGDAAGLAYPQSGEGIRPAIESGLIAASVIIRADHQYTRTRLEPYDRALRARLFAPMSSVWSSRVIPGRLARALTPRLFAWPAFVRRVLLERAFLRIRDSALAADYNPVDARVVL